MDNKKLNIEEFAESLIPNFKERWEMYNITPDELVGKTVISIRAGFSGMGGQIMKVDSVYGIAGSKGRIKLVPTINSDTYGDENHLGWSCDWDERYNSFILFTDEKENK